MRGGPLLSVGTARGHVRYVTDEDRSGAPLEFLVAVLSEPINAALIAIGGLAVVATAAAYLRFRPARRDVAVLRETLRSYDTFVPWMLRLSVGLPLVGAGFAGYLFTPAVEVSFRLLQVGLGFLLLFGLATRAVAIAGLLVYAVGILTFPTLALAGEFVGGFAAIVLLGAGRPSADHMLQRVADAPRTLYGRVDPVHRVANRVRDATEPYERYAPVAVRAALGVTFVLLGVWEKLARPERSLAVVEKYDLTAVVPVDPGLWMVGTASVEIAVGVLLLAGLFTRAAAAAAFLTLTVTLFGLPDDPVLAHVALFGLTSMLFVIGAGPLSLDGRLASEPVDAAPGRGVREEL
jgi:uncharacterized membrane protein YphA (DoxX/SURF4 family)